MGLVVKITFRLSLHTLSPSLHLFCYAKFEPNAEADYIIHVFPLGGICPFTPLSVLLISDLYVLANA